MGNDSFTLRNDLAGLNGEKIGRFDAYFPDTDKDGNAVDETTIPPYVKMNHLVFKTKHNGGNYSIFIAPGNMDPIPKNTPEPVSFVEASGKDFFFFKIKKDKAQRWMLTGLILALIGVAIDAAFAIGKIHVFIPCSESVMILLQVISLVLKISGLLLAFFKGFWESK